MDSLQTRLRYKYPNLKWNLQGIDPRVLTIILSAFDKEVKKYPILLSQLRYIGTDWNSDPDLIASTHLNNPDTTSRDYTSILLNPDFYGDYDKFTKEVKAAESAHYHPADTGTIAASFIHELGHVLMRALLAQRDVSLTPYVGLDNFGLMGPTLELWLASNHADSELSTYALSNPNEAWAEGFAAIESGSPPTPYTTSQEHLLNWYTSLKWLRDWKYVSEAPPATQNVWQAKLVRLAQEYNIDRTMEGKMSAKYEELRKQAAETQKELSTGKLTEKQVEDIGHVLDQLESLLNQLRLMVGPVSTDSQFKWQP